MTTGMRSSFYKTAIAVLLFSVFVKSEVIIESYAGQEASGCPYLVWLGLHSDANHVGMAAASDIAFDANGNAYYAVWSCAVVLYHERSTNLMSILAGYPGVGGSVGDNGRSTAALINGEVQSLKIDPDNKYLYIGNLGLRRIELSTQIITTVAGNGMGYTPEYGDDGPATSASFGTIYGMHFNTSRYLFVSDALSRIRKVDFETGIVTNYAGSVFSWHQSQDGALTSARFDFPSSMWGEDGKGMTVYDANSCAFRKIDMVAGIVSTWWGGRDCLSAGDGGNIADASAWTNVKICGKDRAGNFYFADQTQDASRNAEGGCSIRKIDPSGKITRYAGTKCYNGGYTGEDVLATEANLYMYQGGCSMYDDKVYLTDNQPGGNARIRMVFNNHTDMPSVFPTHNPSYLPSYGPTSVAPTVAPTCYWSAEEDSCGGLLEEVVVSSTNTNVNRGGNSTSTTTVTRTYRKRA